MGYVQAAIPQDRAAIKAGMVADLQAQIPGLQIPAGSWLDFLLDVLASRYAQQGERETEMLDTAFRYGLGRIFRRPAREATQATATSTWTVTDPHPAILDAGTEITLLDADLVSRVAFAVAEDVTLPVGAGATAAGEVPLIAVEAGAAGTGLDADAQPEQTLTWVASIAVVAPTTGGQDGETDAAWLDRLADSLQLLSDTLVLPSDFAIMAREQPGVARALALDLYDAPTDTPGVGGVITVALAAADGSPVGAPTLAAVQLVLDENSITNLTVYTIDPTYTALAVVFDAVAADGYDPAVVETAAEAAVAAFLAPGRWGTPPAGDLLTWVDEPIVRYQDLVTVLNNVQGLDHYTTLTLDGGTADVTLDGPAGLPDPASTVTGTVT